MKTLRMALFTFLLLIGFTALVGATEGEAPSTDTTTIDAPVLGTTSTGSDDVKDASTENQDGTRGTQPNERSVTTTGTPEENMELTTTSVDETTEQAPWFQNGYLYVVGALLIGLTAYLYFYSRSKKA